MNNIAVSYDPTTLRCVVNHTGDEGYDFAATPPVMDGSPSFLVGYHAPRPACMHAVDVSGLEPVFTLVDSAAPLSALESAQLLAKEDLDRMSKVKRSEIATIVDGQDSIYRLKEIQARAFVAAQDAGQNPVVVDYPAIESGLDIDGATGLAVAQTYITKADAWIAPALAADRTRLLAWQAVQAAATVEEIETIMKTVTWPSMEL